MWVWEGWGCRAGQAVFPAPAALRGGSAAPGTRGGGSHGRDGIRAERGSSGRFLQLGNSVLRIWGSGRAAGQSASPPEGCSHGATVGTRQCLGTWRGAVGTRRGAVGTPRACASQPYLYVLQPGVETAASPSSHPAVQLLAANISQAQITNHSSRKRAVNQPLLVTLIRCTKNSHKTYCHGGEGAQNKPRAWHILGTAPGRWGGHGGLRLLCGFVPRAANLEHKEPGAAAVELRGVMLPTPRDPA